MDSEGLIAAIYNKSAIWDKRHKYHSNRNVLENCWREISVEMKQDESKLRKRWKYLRDQFAVELGKIPPSRSGDPGNVSDHAIKWPYFQAMKFLKDIVRPRPSTGNLSKASGAPSMSDETQFSVSTDFDNPHSVIPSPQDEVDIDINCVPENDNTPPAPSASDSSNTVTSLEPSPLSIVERKKRRKPINEYNDSLLEIERQKLQYLQDKASRKRSNENEDDEHLHFLKSLLPHIKKIPQHRLLSFRSRVQEVVESYAYPQISTVPNSPQSSHSISSDNSRNTLESHQSSTPVDISQPQSQSQSLLLDYTQLFN